MSKQDLVNHIENVRIQQYKTDIGFRTLVDGVNENLYIIPKYQRKYRWTKEQATSLIASLINGLPIPPIYAYRNEQNQLEILDGQQRIMSLFFYSIGYYLNKRKNNSINFSRLTVGNHTFQDALQEQFELEELHIQLMDENGMPMNADYAALPLELKRKIDYTSITVIEINIDNKERQTEVIRQIFANLNRGGSLLTPQEQRNGIYVCPFYDMLQDFNRNNDCWRKIWGRESASEKDLETLLRFCALRRYVHLKKESSRYDFVIEEYHSSYLLLLDQFSEEAMDFDEHEIQEYKESLLAFLKLFQVNGTQASKVPLLESFYIVFEKTGLDKPITNAIYEKILCSPEYNSSIRHGTVKAKQMNERWKNVYEIWAGTDE